MFNQRHPDDHPVRHPDESQDQIIAREVSGLLISPDLCQIVLYISGIIHFPQMFPDIYFAEPDI